MRGIMITAPSSGSGKTTITMGIIRALKNMGQSVCAFKTGPDYIDTSFLSSASGLKAGNLDLYIQGEDEMNMALNLGEGDMCVIEGVMGYFDGIYNTYENSSYDISKRIGVNAVLIYTPKGEMFSAVPKIKGMVDFKDSMIKGVILNRVSKKYYDMLKAQIEEYTCVKVIGYIPQIDDIEIESRHLGLIQSMEIDDIEKKLDRLANAVCETVDMQELIKLMREIKTKPIIKLKKRNIRVGIAYDKAFSFYYKENLYLLNSTCEVVYFSPLHDKKLPEVDFIYLGGGYPEVFKEELSKNKAMKNSVRQFADNGGFIYAECGGFMYLTKGIEGYPMVGLLNGESVMTNSLQRFGYIEIELIKDSPFGKCGERLTGHEFHRSKTNVIGDALYKINNVVGNRTWECGYRYKNAFGGYPHINFIGNLNAYNNMLDYIEKTKGLGEKYVY